MIGEVLELSRPFVAAEPWRLWTGHLVHFGAAHFLFNLLAIIPPALLMGKENLRRVVIWWILCSPLLSALLFFDPSWTAVRGASGLAVGLWIFAPLVCRERSHRGIIVAMLTLVALKIVAETVSGWTVSNLENPPLVSAHWFGALLGLLSASIVRWRESEEFDSTLWTDPQTVD